MWYLHEEKMYLKEANSEFRMKLDIHEMCKTTWEGRKGEQRTWSLENGTTHPMQHTVNLHCLDTAWQLKHASIWEYIENNFIKK